MTTEHPSEQPRRHIGHALVHHAAGLVRNPDIQIIRDLIYLAFGQFGAKFAAFLLYAYLARVLAPRDYGALETMLAILAFAALVVDFGLGAAAVRHRAQKDPDRDLVIAVVPALRLLLALLCIPGVWIAVLVVTDDPVVRTLGGLLSLSLLLQAWRQEWLLQSLELMRLVALGQFLRVAVQAGVAILLIRGAADLAWFGLAEIAAAATMAVFYVAVQIRAGFLPGLSLERSVAGPLLRQAFPLGLTAAIWGIVQNLPTILVGVHAGLEQAAYLAAAQRLTTSLQSLSHIYHFNMYAALNRRYRQGTGQLQKLSLASMRVVAWASIGPAAICAALSGDILRLVFGPDYTPAAPVLAILIFIVPVQILSGHHRWALIAAGDTKPVLTAGITGAAISTLVTFALMPLGAVGGAIAVLAAGLGIWAVSILACHKRGLPLPVLPRIWRPLVCAALAVLPILLLPDVPVLPRLLASVIIYATLGLIVDKPRIYSDLRHFAYAKQDTRS